MLLLIALAGAAPGCSTPEKEPEPEAPSLALRFDGEVPSNVLMISIDTLRRDHVGRYDGSDRSPTLDRLLSEGFTLDDHRSCASWTWPSVLCALSGRNIADLGVMSPSPAYQPPVLPESVVLLSDWLKAEGYATGLVTANSFITESFGLVRGYDLHNDPTEERPGTRDIGPLGLEALDALKATGAPWFLHMHYLDPHDPYAPPDDYRPDIDTSPVRGVELMNHQGVEDIAYQWKQLTADEQALVRETLTALYNAEIQLLDDALAVLFEALEERGDLDDTLVVLWSDHGEQFWEHGSWYHRQGLHDEESATIASFWAKSLLPGSTTAPTTHLDLAPTLMTALGMAPPDVIVGDVIGSFGRERPRFAHAMKADASLQSVDCEGRRLIGWWNGDREYYLLDEDPGELNDLYDPTDPEVMALEALLAPEIERFQTLAAEYE